MTYCSDEISSYCQTRKKQAAGRAVSPASHVFLANSRKNAHAKKPPLQPARLHFADILTEVSGRLVDYILWLIRVFPANAPRPKRVYSCARR